MSVQNKVAIGVAALSGALAVGTDAQAQIVTQTLPDLGFISITTNGTSAPVAANAPLIYHFGPANALTLSLAYAIGGSGSFEGYLRTAAPTGDKFSLLTTNQSRPQNLTFSVGTAISAALAGVKEQWTPKGTSVQYSSGGSKTTFSTVPAYTSYSVFRFSTGSGFNYGWAEYSASSTTNVFKLKLLEIAYAQNGGPISVGETSIPEPASASLLAMGAMAMGARGVRRMKKAQAKMKSAA